MAAAVGVDGLEGHRELGVRHPALAVQREGAVHLIQRQVLAHIVLQVVGGHLGMGGQIVLHGREIIIAAVGLDIEDAAALVVQDLAIGIIHSAAADFVILLHLGLVGLIPLVGIPVQDAVLKLLGQGLAGGLFIVGQLGLGVVFIADVVIGIAAPGALIGKEGQASVHQRGHLAAGDGHLVQVLPVLGADLDEVVLQVAHDGVGGNGEKVHQPGRHLVVLVVAQQVGGLPAHLGLVVKLAVPVEPGVHPVQGGVVLVIGRAALVAGHPAGAVHPVLGVRQVGGNHFRAVHLHGQAALGGEVFLLQSQVQESILVGCVAVGAAEGRRGGHRQHQHACGQTDGHAISFLHRKSSFGSYVVPASRTNLPMVLLYAGILKEK